MKKILITGISGQDGIILSYILIKKKLKVYGVTNKKSTKKDKRINLVNIHKCNFNKIIKKFDEIKPDVIVHFGSSNPSFKKNFNKKEYEYNLKFTKKIIDYISLRDIKLILPSSSLIFKYSKKKINENSKTESKSFYSKFRNDSSKYLLVKKKMNNIKATIVILFNHDSKYRNERFLFPRLIKSIKYKNYNFLKKIYKENISGDFSHADDICQAIFLLIKSKKNPDKIILSSGKRTYINHIIDFFIPNFKFKYNRLNLNKN
ncbi:NAD-dependent epimerase/dehydratase family protein, partial [Candidatus Pelagibacter sp.]|nr:NAD-dependent epimerase/dehydratase family protein [Candidatus Pelagibacter sp.]